MKQKSIGLTGTIASGKDTVVKILKRSGAIVIDADKIGHKTYPLVSVDLVKAFGKTIFKNGRVDRKQLGQLVFNDKRKLNKLNQIMHPVMREEIKSEIKDNLFRVGDPLRVAEYYRNATPKRGGYARRVIINSALPQLFKGLVDEVWVVKASKQARLKRLVDHGLSKEDALKRIKSQAKEKEYLKLADKIIINNGSKKDLNAKVQALLKL